MMGNLGLKAYNDESIALLDDLYDKLTGRRGHDSCLFCHGGNTCRCGQCPESEYHDSECLVFLLDILLTAYRHPREGESNTLVLTTKEELEWYRTRIEELEEQGTYVL